MGATTNVGNITLSDNVNVAFTGSNSTFATGGTVRTITVGNNSTLDLAGQAISTAAGTGFIKSGNGTLSLTGSAYTGGFTLNAGTVAAGGTLALGNGSLTINGGTIRSTNTGARDFSIRFTSGITIGGNFTLGDAFNNGALTFASTMALGASERVITLNSAATFAGNLTGSGGGINKQGAGTLTLSGTNTYTGSTTISSGTLLTTKALALAGYTTAGKVVFNGGTLGVQVGGSGWTDTELGNLLSNATKTSGAIGIDTTNGSYTQSFAFTTTNMGGLGLTKLGVGNLTLNLAGNDYTGVTTIGNGVGNGTLILSGSGSLGSTAAGTVVATGSSLGLSGGGTFGSGETLTIVGAGIGSRGALQSITGNNTYAGNIEIGANGGFNRIGTQDGASLNLTGNITQAAGVTTGSILFRTGLSGDWVILSGTGNSFGDNSTVFSGAASGVYGGVRLGANNALPTNRTISGVTSTGNATALDLNGYNQTLNGLTTGQAAISIINQSGTPSTLTLNPSSDAGTNNTFILGGAGLGVISVEKIGSFRQTLSGNNTYSGGTTVTGGALWIGSNSVPSGTGTVSASPIGTGNLTLGEGTALALSSSTSFALYVPRINIGGNITIGTTANTGRLSLMGTVDLGGGNRIITLGRASSNATAPYVSGAEIFRFDNNATFGGSSIVQNGSLTLTTTTGNATVPSIARALGVVNFANNTALTLDDGVGFTGGTGSFFGTGTNAPALTLNAPVSRGGGVLQMGDGINSGNATMRSPEVYSLSGGGTVSSSNTSGNVTTGTLTINNGNGANFSGIITEAGGVGIIAVTKNGNGTQTFSGNNSYSGLTTVNGGSLVIASSGSIASGNALTVNANGTAEFQNAGQTLGAVTNANTAANALNFSASTGNVTLASLSGAGNTRFGSNGIVTGGISSGTVTSVGSLTANISGGTVTAGGLLTGNITSGTVGAGSLSSASVTGGTNTITGAAGITTLNGGTTTVGGVATIGTFTSGTANLNGATSTITTLDGGTVNLGSTVLTVSGGAGASISGSGGSLVKDTASILTLASGNTFGGGTTITGGLINFSAPSSFGSGNITLDGGGVQWASSYGGGDLSSGRTVTIASGGGTFDTNGNSITLAGTVGGGGTGQLIKTGAGSLSIGTLSSTGGTSVQQGSLSIGSGGATGDIATTGGTTTAFGGTSNYTGSISGAGNVAINAGTVTFSGNSSYTGTTDITGTSTFVVNGNLTGAGALTVGSGATLMGGGSIAGSTTVQSGGLLSPGNSPGSLVIGDNLYLAGSVLVELGGTAFTLNGTEEYDRIKLSGTTATLDLTGSTLNVAQWNSFVPVAGDAFGIFQLESGASISSTLGGFAEGATVATIGGVDIKITYVADFGDSGPVALFGGNDIALYAAIPEPSTYAALAGASMIGFALYRRRRQHAAKRAA